MSIKISENTNVGLPLRNLIGLIGAIVVGAWFAFGVIERLNQLETKNQLFEKDLLEASCSKTNRPGAIYDLGMAGDSNRKNAKNVRSKCTHRCNVI
jgi:hypothetical protein